jgi:ABC-type uncharacterized transport system substrate-binding protein
MAPQNSARHGNRERERFRTMTERTPMYAGRFAAAALSALALAGSSIEAQAARCLFVSSYHQGYAWSDGVERGLRSVLEGRCELRQFDMDTKRSKDEASRRNAAEQARALIESWKPDVIITADDAAAKYLIVPFYRNHTLPFVFSGVNWTAKEYGFPFSNVTGMVEVAPIRTMLKAAQASAGGSGSAFYLGADTFTERKNLVRVEEAATELGLVLESRLVGSASEWIEAHAQAQDTHAFLVLGSHAGIDDWEGNVDRVRAAVRQSSRRLSVTNHDWMMPFAMLGMTKIPEEQGIWSAQAALAILEGTRPSEIPIIANRQWDVWVNQELLEAARLELPDDLRRRAKKML